MEQRGLGRSGCVVSAVGLGCNNFGRRLDAQRSAEVVHAALDAGVTLFDTADVYSESEVYLGQALKGRRDEVVIATKFGLPLAAASGPTWGARGGRRYVRAAVERSLRRLGTDRIDLYQLHAPDPMTPIDETLDALSDLVREGKVLYVGSSQFAAWQVVDAHWEARANGHVHFVSAQNRYNLLEREAERELLPACRHLGIGLLPFFPLANGLLTGKYRRGEAPPSGSRLEERPEARDEGRLVRVEALEAFAATRGVTLLDVAFGGLLAHAEVASVIAGATSPAQVSANAAAGRWRPGPEEVAELDRLGQEAS